ncbi:recombinase family protein [Neorhizobium alkalisoli]|uniref:Putative DNA-invertase from lambdoid prophage Rac n=1 Tax=Neorhizobium alkalisoli TaxID=528178 RepID=A0A561PSU3_9HYPH|nr:recombinase family protein [Neorhizobium alkalisoli]TWF41185.1 putative DNA-invertase from lambdoid prophage Rac [Neorhizobium alkalisoli]
MSRTFAYCRVSSSDQTTESQLDEISRKGFTIEQPRIVSENISGKVPAAQRPGFQKLLDRMEHGDRLVVTKLDRLGRNAIDIETTVRVLRENGIEVHCIALEGFELTSAIGDLVFRMLTAFAQFERDLISERTHAGLSAAKAKGKVFGRPKSLTAEQVAVIKREIGSGATISAMAKRLDVSRATVMRALN